MTPGVISDISMASSWLGTPLCTVAKNPVPQPAPATLPDDSNSPCSPRTVDDQLATNALP